MREITRSVKAALKCLIAVVLVGVNSPYWTSKVEDIVAFAAIVSNICSAHAQKRLFMHFRCKFRHRRSIRRPHASTPTSIIPTKFEVDMCIHCQVIAFLSADTSRDLVTLTFDLLNF